MIDPMGKNIGNCPMNGKLCIDGIRTDFEKDANGFQTKCRWWQHIAGKDPQSEKIIDNFDCTIPWLTVTTVETAQAVRQNTASTDKVANEVLALKQGVVKMAGAINAAGSGISKAIEAGALTVMLPPPGGLQEPNGHEERNLE